MLSVGHANGIFNLNGTKQLALDSMATQRTVQMPDLLNRARLEACIENAVS